MEFRGSVFCSKCHYIHDSDSRRRSIHAFLSFSAWGLFIPLYTAINSGLDYQKMNENPSLFPFLSCQRKKSQKKQARNHEGEINNEFEILVVKQLGYFTWPNQLECSSQPSPKVALASHAISRHMSRCVPRSHADQRTSRDIYTHNYPSFFPSCKYESVASSHLFAKLHRGTGMHTTPDVTFQSQAFRVLIAHGA